MCSILAIFGDILVAVAYDVPSIGNLLGSSAFETSIFKAVPDGIGRYSAHEKKRKHPKIVIKLKKNKSALDFLVLFECCYKTHFT